MLFDLDGDGYADHVGLFIDNGDGARILQQLKEIHQTETQVQEVLLKKKNETETI